MKGFLPSSIYMRGKGGQQNVCGPKPLQAPYKSTFSLTYVEYYPRIHIPSSKLMKNTSNSLMQVISMRCAQHSSSKLPMTLTILIGHVIQYVPSPYMKIVTTQVSQVKSMPPCKNPSYPMLSRARFHPLEFQMLIL